MRYNRNVDISEIKYADSSPSKHDDSCKPVECAARAEFTKDSSSAALPFAVHHRTGDPVHRYFSQPRLYLVTIIALKSAIVNTFLKILFQPLAVSH